MSGHEGWEPFPDGTIVRHRGQQYAEAVAGTGCVVRHYWRGPWLEYVVAPLPGFGPDYFGTDGMGMWSADYVVRISEELLAVFGPGRDRGGPCCSEIGPEIAKGASGRAWLCEGCGWRWVANGNMAG